MTVAHTNLNLFIKALLNSCTANSKEDLNTDAYTPLSNHLEFIVLSKNTVSSHASQCMQVFDSSLAKEEFYRILYRMMDTNFKYHQKQYKETIIGNTVYHNNKNEEISIFKVTTHAVQVFNDVLLASEQHKVKQSILGLPSTNNVNCESYIRRITFRVSNRIFVNFENGMCDEKNFYKITVNYNHDKDVDVSNIAVSIEKTLKLIM